MGKNYYIITLMLAISFVIIITPAAAEDPEGFIPGNCTLDEGCDNTTYNGTNTTITELTNEDWQQLVDDLIDNYNESMQTLLKMRNTTIVRNETKYYSWIALSGEAFEKWLSEKTELDEKAEANSDLRSKLDLLDRETFELKRQNIDLQAQMVELANASNTIAIHYDYLKTQNIQLEESLAAKEKEMSDFQGLIFTVLGVIIVIVAVLGFLAWRFTGFGS